ncbi:DUF1801 domain-containing protein [Rufibacter latericius]|uniref:DUF1801 domain-containing protein n=1 Tax=Rufibacter latericius TaxID=2487040 RepID=A0A3M9N1H3_9BACT|nr:DUF1801 domain-containing protein [Rufibacter latericius]RNI31632.1 DUF1801 domain-containing protein [Rufibacter latericius]
MEAEEIQKFDTVEELLAYLPLEERKLVAELRQLVFECLPFCSEKLSYNVPFYVGHTRICFIWPGSVPWGTVKQKGVQLGFCNGNLLQDDADYLEKGKRKQVFTKTFAQVNELDYDLIKVLLYEAGEVDGRLFAQKKEKSKIHRKI